MSEYPNWFEIAAIHFFERNLLALAGQDLHALQIGAYTGDASRWLMNNVLTSSGSTLTDVDTWQGSDEEAHKSFDWADVEEVYTAKLADVLTSGNVKKCKTTSEEFFSTNTEQFDFIYVDADHTALGVLKDGMNAYNALKIGGILAFDDFEWEPNGLPHLVPKHAINAIRIVYYGKLQLIDLGYQAWFRKIA